MKFTPPGGASNRLGLQNMSKTNFVNLNNYSPMEFNFVLKMQKYFWRENIFNYNYV